MCVCECVHAQTRVWGRGRGRGRGRSRLATRAGNPTWGSILEPWDRGMSQKQKLNHWATQAPHCKILTYFKRTRCVFSRNTHSVGVQWKMEPFKPKCPCNGVQWMFCTETCLVAPRTSALGAAGSGCSDLGIVPEPITRPPLTCQNLLQISPADFVRYLQILTVRSKLYSLQSQNKTSYNRLVNRKCPLFLVFYYAISSLSGEGIDLWFAAAFQLFLFGIS